jgi:histone acetyltransferase (RNA polymerase elongator complex component)
MGKIIPAFIPNAGCPHQCVFCNQKTISGQQTNGLEAAKAQIEKYGKWVKPSINNEIAFYGGSFTALPIGFQEDLLKLGNQYLDKGWAGSIRLSTRPDYINDTELELLRRYRVRTVELGAQSLDDRVLVLAERGHTAQDVVRAVALLRKYNFRVGLQFMLGLPGQDAQSFSATIAKGLELHPDIVRLYPLLVIKDTPLAQSFQTGKYIPLTLDEAVKECYEAYEAFTKAGITVIRMGLQPDAELMKVGNILAGPFHPSFGELVKSYGYKVYVEKIIAQLPPGDYTIDITVPPKLASIVRGINRSNVKAWEASGKIQVKFQEGSKFEVTYYDRKTV